MKICYKCGAGNPDSAVVCRECGESVTDAAISRAEDIAKEKTDAIERRERRIRFLKLMLIPMYFIIVTPMCIITLINEPEAWLPVLIIAIIPLMYYLSVFKADLLFELEYMFKPEVSYAEPSDWYYTGSEIGGYVTLVFGIGFAIWLMCQCI